LAPAAFIPLPLGVVEPRGWLLSQLRLQAWSITGHLDEIWPDVGPASGWLGGPAENWERGPYYVDGLVALAYSLWDEVLIGKAQRWIEWSLASQRPDGLFGPADRPDWWSRMPMLKALTQYHEATDDARALDVLDAYFRAELSALPSDPLQSWGRARGGENILCAHWLYNRTGDAYLLELAELLHRQTVDWTGMFLDFASTPFTGKQTSFDHRIHVVNVAMALKEPGLHYRQSRDPRHRSAPRAGLDNLMRYHGLANGLFSGDEWLAGQDPSQGTETCAVVELMFSLEILSRLFGEVALADHLEKVAFNALPACQTPDLWGHQYDQQPNQVLCSIEKRAWTQNGVDANLFGLAPHFGCCTANLHQGWPKLAASLWAATPDGGLAALVYAPCAVTARVGPGDGVQALVIADTTYPFGGEIRVSIHVSGPASFPLYLRVPGWAGGARVQVGDDGPIAAPAGRYLRIERSWRDGDTVKLSLPLEARLADRPRGAVSVERGPLVFSLPVGEAWIKARGSEPCPDWEVHPTTPWNYGLIAGAGFEVETRDVGFQPFDQPNAPVRVKTLGKRVPDWRLVAGSAGPVAEAPSSSEPAEEISLMPYGCARLRVTEMPRVT
jgi:hypothetical protein